jgi:hypothetical protein
MVGKEDSNCIRNFTALLAQPPNSHGFQTYQQFYGIDFMLERACFLLGPRWGQKIVSYVSMQNLLSSSLLSKK